MDVFTAIADPTRRALLRQLTRGPARVVDLAAAHPVSRPAISRHLRILGTAGLVVAADHGRERHYHLEPAPLAEVGKLVSALTDVRPPITDRHLDALATEVRRTTRDRRNGAPRSSRTTQEEQSA